MTARDQATVGAIAAAAAIAAVAADGSPTGTVWIDALQRAAFVAVIVLAASRARRWTLVLAAMVTGVSSSGWGLVAGLSGLVFLSLLAFTDRRDRTLSAAAGACISVAVLRMDLPGPFGIETLVAVAALTPLLWSGYAVASKRVQRRVRTTLAVVGAVVAVFVAGGIVAGATSVAGVEAANSALDRGLNAANDGRTDDAVTEFASAGDQLDSASGRLGAFWAVGARTVPVIGVNYRAVQKSVDTAAELADVGRSLAEDVDFDRIRRVEGGIDIDLLRGFGAPMEDAAARLDVAGDTLAGVESGFLLGPLDKRLGRARDDLATLDEEVDTAVIGIADGPEMLGSSSPRRYLFLLGSPAELRALGGHIGNWAEVTIDQGKLDLVDVGGPRDLSQDEASAPEQLAAFPDSVRSMQPARFPQNWGSSADMPTVARLSALLFESKTGRPVDGVVYADPAAFAGLLGVTGPIAVQGLPEPFDIDEANAVDFLTVDQYAVFPDDNAARLAVQALVETLFDELTSLQLPGPRTLSSRFSPLVRSGSLQMASVHESDERLLERLGMLGAVVQPADGDLLGILNQNAAPNKADSYLVRESVAEIVWDPTTGAVSTVVTVTLTNNAPPAGLSRTVIGNGAGLPWGTNLTDLIIMTPFAQGGTTIDGVDTPTQPLLEDSGLWHHRVRVSIPSGESRTVRMELNGRVGGGPEYRLAVVGQALLQEGPLVVQIDSTEGILEGPGAAGDTGAAAVALDNHTDRLIEWNVMAD